MHMYKTWYEPFDTQKEIDKSLWWTLSQDITTAALPGDLRLWPMIIDAAERFKKMQHRAEQDKGDGRCEETGCRCSRNNSNYATTAS